MRRRTAFDIRPIIERTILWIALAKAGWLLLGFVVTR